jgi:hypothetical protein
LSYAEGLGKCYVEAVLKVEKLNNMERLFKGEAYRLTGYGIKTIEIFA